jgi:DNA topoisomerase VI subunit B
VDDFIEQTSLANPRHAALPGAEEDVRVFEAVAKELPVASKEIKPHPTASSWASSCA